MWRPLVSVLALFAHLPGLTDSHSYVDGDATVFVVDLNKHCHRDFHVGRAWNGSSGGAALKCGDDKDEEFEGRIIQTRKELLLELRQLIIFG